MIAWLSLTKIAYGEGSHLNFDAHDNSLDLDLAKSVAGYSRLSEQQADVIIKRVLVAVSGWQQCAKKYKIRKAEQDRMRVALS